MIVIPGIAAAICTICLTANGCRGPISAIARIRAVSGVSNSGIAVARFGVIRIESGSCS